MAETALSVQDMSMDTPLVPAYTAADGANDNSFANAGSGMRFVHVKNEDTATHTCTITAPTACDRGETHNLTGTIAASNEKIFGPLPASIFADGGTTVIQMDTTDSITMGVVECPVT